MNKDLTPKIAKLRKAWAAGEKIKALSIAAKFPELGAERGAILTAWAAHTNPRFYRQLGRCPAEIVKAGLSSMEKKYGLRRA